MARRQRRQQDKKFWSKRKKILVVTLTIIGLLVVANAILLYHPPQPSETLSFPIYLATSNSHIPSGSFPINKTAVSQFVNNTIADYNGLLGSKQETWSNFTSIQHFFDLYLSNGSWIVQVGRDNGSYSDYIEFIFRPTTQDANPRTVVYTNESAEYLRPLTGTQLLVNNINVDYQKTDYGIILAHYYSQSAAGGTLIPLVWITNSSLVYGDVAANANNAALSIYQYDVQTMNKALNPPYPSYGWWLNVWNRYQLYIEVAVLATGIFIIYGTYLYLRGRKESESKKEPKVQ
jgi:hypothetical protein